MTKDYGVAGTALLAISLTMGCGLVNQLEVKYEYPDIYAKECADYSTKLSKRNLAFVSNRDARIERAKTAAEIVCDCIVEKLEERLPHERAVAAEMAIRYSRRKADPEDIAIVKHTRTECELSLPTDFAK